MRQRGRKRPDDHEATGVEPTRNSLRPPAHLSKAEREIFCEVVATSPTVFVASDTFLLATFATVTQAARAAAADMRKETQAENRRSIAKLVVELSKAQTNIATKLRLTPNARVHPRTVGRRAEEHRPSAYDVLRGESDGGWSQ